MIANLFAPLGMKIATGAALGAFLALGVVMWRADAISAQRDALRTQLAQEQATHAVTRLSVGRLEAEIARIMADAKAREAEFNANKAQAERDKARLAGLAKASDARIARLLAMANEPGTCPVDPALLAELEGL